MRPLSAIPTLTLMLCGSVTARATAQYPDRIIIGGKTLDMNTNPLEKYFEAHPEKRPKGGISSTACWRGYVATWEIAESEFLLRKIDIRLPDPSAKKGEWKTITENRMKSVFPTDTPVVADWYSGTLVLPQGELVNYVHMGYGSTFEKYTLITIDKGKVIKQLDLSLKDFNEYRIRQFKEFKKTEEYKLAFAESKKDGGSESEIDGFLVEFLSERFLSIQFPNAK